MFNKVPGTMKSVWGISVLAVLLGGCCCAFAFFPSSSSSSSPAGNHPRLVLSESRRTDDAVLELSAAAKKNRDGDNSSAAFMGEQHRRKVLAQLLTATTTAAGLVLLPGSRLPASAMAITARVNDDDDSSSSSSSSASSDLTTQLFNADGSLKDDSMKTEAKMRSVKLQWADDADTDDGRRLTAVDGANDAAAAAARTAGTGQTISITYDVPEKWDAYYNYVDATTTTTTAASNSSNNNNKERACSRITVYQAPGTVSADRLSGATRMGIAKALDVPEELKGTLSTADLIGGRSRRIASVTYGASASANAAAAAAGTAGAANEDQVYYEFDMAIAPASCSGGDADDLRLGFCPYDRVYLLAATTVNRRLYVLCIEADRQQWKRANADLRRVRSSFRVVQKTLA